MTQAGCLLVMWSASFSVAQSQNEVEPTYNSPYSILGIGDLNDQPYAASLGMGGLTATYHDPFHLNPLNPASLGWLRSTSFEVGVFGRRAELDAGRQTEEVWSGNLNYLALGFPLRNPINELLDRIVPEFSAGMMFSLAPYSTVSYDIEVNSPLSETSNSRGVFKGTGGTYRLAWGNGFRYKNFGAGVNLGYVFGRINNTRQAFIDGETIYYFDDFADDINVNGFVWNAGVAYDYEFKSLNRDGVLEPNGKKISVGLYGNSNMGFSTTSDRLYRRVYSVTDAPIPTGELGDRVKDLRVDTLINAIGVNEQGTLPAAYTFGLSYVDQDKLMVGVEYGSSLWSNYTNEAKPDDLSDAFRFSAGLEWIPDATSYNRAYKRFRYRLGAFYENDPRTFNGEQLTKRGLTIGLGLPLTLPRQQTSFVNFALEGGQFGLSDVIDENYFKMTLGFTLNDNSWFFKRKFD